MTKKAFDQIAEGLTEALAIARGEADHAAEAAKQELASQAQKLKMGYEVDRLVNHRGVIDSLSSEQIAALAKMPLGPEVEIGKFERQMKVARAVMERDRTMLKELAKR